MINTKYSKYIFLLVAILNAIFQLVEKPILLKNWISAVGFVILSIMFFIRETNKSVK